MKLLIVLFISLFLMGCEEKVYEDPKQDYVSVALDTANVYSDISLNDILVNDKNVEIISDNYQIDTDELGEKEYEIYYRVDKKKYVYKYKVRVVDSEAPIVFSGVSKSVKVGYDEDLCNLITYGDNYTGDVKCEITGDYDLNKAGTYKLHYKLSDSSNNTKEVNVTLTVYKPSTGGSSSNSGAPAPKTEFADIYKMHKNDNTEIGIDVSKWQEDIDFNKVKNAGATFVMMRIGVQTEKNGELSVDRYYEQNIKNAKEAGLKVGVYLYTMASSTKEAKEHAEWVVKTLDGEKLDLPIVFDWENWNKWNTYKLSFHEINEIANTYMSTAKEKGYEGMLYSSKFYLETIWENKKEFPVWLAHYTKDAKTSSYKGKYQIWQLCNNGHIDGINGDVDIDVLYK